MVITAKERTAMLVLKICVGLLKKKIFKLMLIAELIKPELKAYVQNLTQMKSDTFAKYINLTIKILVSVHLPENLM